MVRGRQKPYETLTALATIFLGIVGLVFTGIGRKAMSETPKQAKQKLMKTLIALATIFLGIIGVWMTKAKDDFDRASKKLDVTMSLMPKCSSTQPSDWAYVNQLIGAQSVFPIESMTRYFADPNFDQFLIKCSHMVHDAAATTPPTGGTVPIPNPLPESATGNTAPPESAPPGPNTPSAPPNEGDRFWIYLGTLKGKTWETRYLDFPTDFDPVKFNQNTNQKVYKVGPNPLNVRYGVFSPTGSFPPITKALQPDSKVTLRSTAQWFDSGNWWATIEQPPTNP